MPMDTYSAPGFPDPDSEPLLAIGEAAKLLAVSVSTMQRWDREGSLVALRTPGGMRRYRRADLLAAVSRAA